MSLSMLCVLLTGLLPILLTGAAKFAANGFDNREPRPFLDSQTGWRKRAHWAHLNAFEAFPLFAFAVIMAHLNQANSAAVDSICLLFLLFRVLHAFFYIANWATLRTMAWVGGLACVFALFTVT